MKDLENNLVAAALNLAGATMSHAALLPIPNTTPQLYVGYGEPDQLRGMLPEAGVPGGQEKALADAINHGTGVLMGGKHAPFADLWEVPASTDLTNPDPLPQEPGAATDLNLDTRGPQ